MSFMREALQLPLLFLLRKSERTIRTNNNLVEIWRSLQTKYFPDSPWLNDYEIIWSNRKNKRTLASCHIEKKRVLVAPAMTSKDSRVFLDALLYHEMCHAVLGAPAKVRGRRQIHGKDFKILESRHPGIPALNKWISSGGWSGAARRHNRRRS